MTRIEPRFHHKLNKIHVSVWYKVLLTAWTVGNLLERWLTLYGSGCKIYWSLITWTVSNGPMTLVVYDSIMLSLSASTKPCLILIPALFISRFSPSPSMNDSTNFGKFSNEVGCATSVKLQKKNSLKVEQQ